jgi:hypothetical protein
MIWWLLTVGAASMSSQTEQRNTAVGTWRGQSKCVVTASACRDEDSLYRGVAVAGSQTKMTLTADKIVDGREISMGTSECSFSLDTHVLKCPLPNGAAIRFELKGDSLNGTMTLSDGTEWRRIALRRVPATHKPS